jgi:DNA-directed RNA polymerase subunit RPC12/RpoP
MDDYEKQDEARKIFYKKFFKCDMCGEEYGLGDLDQYGGLECVMCGHTILEHEDDEE